MPKLNKIRNKGIIPDTLSTVLNNFLFFYAFAFLRTRIVARQTLRSTAKAPVVLSAFQEVAIGCAAGLFSKFITTPLSNITVRAQTEKRRSVAKGKKAAKRVDSDSDDSDDEYSGEVGLMEIARTIHSERGFTGFFSGFQSSILLVCRFSRYDVFGPFLVALANAIDGITDDKSSYHALLLRPAQANAHSGAASIPSDSSSDLPRWRTRFIDGFLPHLSAHSLQDAPPVPIPFERSTSVLEHFRRACENAPSRGSNRIVSGIAGDVAERIFGARTVHDD